MATVLVAENDAGIGELLVELLSEEGYRVLLTTRTDEALTMLATEGVDLIIADLESGSYGDGSWDGIRQLRHVAATNPIIVCTGHRQAMTLLPEQVGANATLLKPFEVEHLLNIVAHYC